MDKIFTREDAKKLTGEHIVIPEGFTEIAFDAFRLDKGESIKSIEFPESMTAIERWASCFMTLERVKIPGSVKIIGHGAFAHCARLKEIILSPGLIAIEGNAFTRCAITSITIPATVKYLYQYNEPERGDELYTGMMYEKIFAGCKDLREINVDPDNLYFSSHDGVLFNKDKTILLDYPAGKPGTSYTVPSGVKIIGGEAFGGCNLLKNIVIPNSVTEIDYQAFIFCKKLKTFSIPESVTKIDETAFQYNKYITDINVDENNESYSSADGVLFNKDKTVLIKYPAGKMQKIYEIPSSVTKIDEYAFEHGVSERVVKEDEEVIIVGDKSEYEKEARPAPVKIIFHDNVSEMERYAFIERYAFNKDERYIIVCANASPAHDYAVKNGIAFELAP